MNVLLENFSSKPILERYGFEIQSRKKERISGRFCYFNFIEAIEDQSCFQQPYLEKREKCGETEFIGDIASFTGVRIPSPAPFWLIELVPKGSCFLQELLNFTKWIRQHTPTLTPTHLNIAAILTV